LKTKSLGPTTLMCGAGKRPLFQRRFEVRDPFAQSFVRLGNFVHPLGRLAKTGSASSSPIPGRPRPLFLR